MINKHLGVLPIGTSYWTNYVLSSIKVLGFTQKHQATNLLLTWQLMDILPRLKLLNAVMALTHSCWFPYLCYLQPTGIYLKEAHSGLEPELPVHFRTWTWNAGNITQSLICCCTYFTFTYISILNVVLLTMMTVNSFRVILLQPLITTAAIWYQSCLPLC
jgi:hypothetical protein